MATNHTCSFFTDTAGRDFTVIKTLASNIKLVNFGEAKYIRDTTYYGMNASFFNTDTNNILSIAVQDGVKLGTGSNNGGDRNLVGTSLVSWNGTALRYADNVISSSSYMVPTAANTWAQGGFGLFLCDRDWETEFDMQPGAGDMGGGSARTGILINTTTKYVHLFMSRILTTSVYDLRRAMMEYAGLTEGGSAGSWKGLMLDGGRSAQMYCDSLDSRTIASRGVPQIISLKNKN